MGEKNESPVASEQDYAVLLKILRKQNLKETEEALRREAGINFSNICPDSVSPNEDADPTRYHHGYSRISPTSSVTTKVAELKQSAMDKVMTKELQPASAATKALSLSATPSPEVDSTTGDNQETSLLQDKSPSAQSTHCMPLPVVLCPPSLLQTMPPLIYPFSAPLLGSRFPLFTMTQSVPQHLPYFPSPASMLPVPAVAKPFPDTPLVETPRQQLSNPASSESTLSNNCTSPIDDVDGLMDCQESVADLCTYAEIRQFADDFKTRRMKLGYTQGGVGVSLAEKGFSNFAQSTISRFEQMQLSPRNAAAIKNVLEKWLIEVENPHLKSSKLADKPNCRRRKKRIVFSTESKAFLEDMYHCNPKPDRHSLEVIAKELSLLPEEVRIWFCNKRQKERSSSSKRDSISSFLASSPASSVDSSRHGRSPSPPSNFSIEELSKSSSNSSSPSPVGSPQYCFTETYQNGVVRPVAAVLGSQ